MIDRRIRPKEAAMITGFSEKTLANKRSDGTGPPYYKLGNTRRAAVYYLESELKNWMAINMGQHLLASGQEIE